MCYSHFNEVSTPAEFNAVLHGGSQDPEARSFASFSIDTCASRPHHQRERTIVMRHLNYSHLQYFWTVAREGSIAMASKVLHLTPQTISGQLKMLEDQIGEPLFQRVGRGLVLTDTGHLVNQYADEIFSLGAELTERVKGTRRGLPSLLNVGTVNSIAKLIGCNILRPALELPEPVRVVCVEGTLEALLADLSVHRLDIVLSDRAIPAGLNVRAYAHLLGESTVSFFASRKVASRYLRNFPKSLDGAPVLLPVARSALRRSIDEFFEREEIRPHVVAEVADSAMLKALGEVSASIFPAPTAIASQVEEMYRCRRLGDIETVKETYFAISPERKLKHPAVLAITKLARDDLFALS
jgi:LysR family transcriptional activator of nhaA